MRIAHLSESSIPSRDANALQVMKMCHAFGGLGHTVTLYARPGTEACDDVYGYYGVDRRFEVVYRNRRGPGRLGKAIYGVSVARAVRAAAPVDLLYARDPFSLVVLASSGRPMVFEAHVMPCGRIMRRMQGWLFGRPNFRRLVVITGLLGDAYRACFPSLPQEKILVVPSGADVPAQPPSTGRSNGRLQVGYIGQLYPGKGMEVVTPLARLLPDVDFHVVGGTSNDLARWRQEAGDAENLRFHGYLPPTQADAVRQSMDVILAPTQARMHIAGGTALSAAWTSPLKVFEAMAAGKPIIASDLPSFREVLEDGGQAMLVPPEDVEQWAVAIRRLQRDAGLRRQMGQSGYERVRRCYGWDHRARLVLEGL